MAYIYCHTHQSNCMASYYKEKTRMKNNLQTESMDDDAKKYRHKRSSDISLCCKKYIYHPLTTTIHWCHSRITPTRYCDQWPHPMITATTPSDHTHWSHPLITPTSSSVIPKSRDDTFKKHDECFKQSA